MEGWGKGGKEERREEERERGFSPNNDRDSNSARPKRRGVLGEGG